MSAVRLTNDNWGEIVFFEYTCKWLKIWAIDLVLEGQVTHFTTGTVLNFGKVDMHLGCTFKTKLINHMQNKLFVVFVNLQTTMCASVDVAKIDCRDVERSNFDYIIGSSHYFKIGDEYCAIDSGADYFKECLLKFDNDFIKLSKNYYETFVSYIKKRKPDIVGHFDLITKFDEIDESLFLNNEEYIKIANEYIKSAAEEDVIFEVNTGAIARGYRKTPYPSPELLYVLKKSDAKLILSSDSHSATTLDFYFKEAKKLLTDIGFRYVYEFDDGVFKKRFL